MAFFKAEKGQRNADFIVEVALVFQSVVFCRHDRMGHFLGCCFADAARDSDNGNPEQASVISRKVKQSFAGAFNDNLSAVKPAVSLTDNRLCSAFNRFCGKIVAVKIFTLYGNKKTARGYFSRVGANLREASVKLRCGADRLSRLPECYGLHLPASVFPESIPATTSLSS